MNIQIEGKGSSTAPPALIEGTAQLGPMSREMKASEIDAFEKKYGYKPTAIKVAIDALAVFAHKDNPIKGLTLQQVDSIFSSTNKHDGETISICCPLCREAFERDKGHFSARRRARRLLRGEG